MHAISTITSVSTSRPVISRSIHTSGSSPAVGPAFEGPALDGVVLGSGTRRTLSADGPRVDSPAMTAAPVVWRPDAELLSSSNVAVSWPRSRSTISTRWSRVDQQSGVVLGRGRALPRPSVREALRPGARREWWGSVGDVVRRWAVQSRGRVCSTGLPTIRRSATRQQSCGRARRATSARSRGPSYAASPTASRRASAAGRPAR